jgi:hypothetical protein
MSKTLSESAAEILRASMNAGKEPMQSLADPVNDLGGATPEDDYSGGPGHGEKDIDPSVGIAAAAAVKEAPKPGVSSEEGEKKMNSVKSKGLAAPATADATMNPNIGESTEEDASEEVVTENSSEEVVEEAVEETEEVAPVSAKELVAQHMGSMKEDVDALFNGESLSEDFRVKATLIFEAAVSSRVEKIVEQVLAENNEVLAAAYEEIKSELSEQVDEYLNYVVEEWVNENQVAIETGLRAELAEDFINGLKNLFAEHYIEIPDEKVDVAEELAVELVRVQEEAEKKTAEIASLTEQVNSIKKEKAIRLACEGLTEVQAGKMKSLAESVEFTAEGDFSHKLAVIRENYFPSKSTVKSEVKELQQAAQLNEEPEVAQVNNIMAHYVKAISKTAAKA